MAVTIRSDLFRNGFKLRFYYLDCRRYLHYYFKRTLSTSSSAQPNVKHEREQSSSGETERKLPKSATSNDRRSAGDGAGEKFFYAHRLPDSKFDINEGVMGKYKNIEERNGAGGKQQQQKRQKFTEFFYENRTFKRKLRHTVMRLRDKMFVFKRYRLLCFYIAFCVVTLITLHVTIAYKYGTDMPATQLVYLYRKYITLSLKPEHIQAEERLRVGAEMSRLERERQKMMK